MKQYKYCLRCGRELKSDQAKNVGMGKICYEKSLRHAKLKPLFDTKKV